MSQQIALDIVNDCLKTVPDFRVPKFKLVSLARGLLDLSHTPTHHDDEQQQLKTKINTTKTNINQVTRAMKPSEKARLVALIGSVETRCKEWVSPSIMAQPTPTPSANITNIEEDWVDMEVEYTNTTYVFDDPAEREMNTDISFKPTLGINNFNSNYNNNYNYNNYDQDIVMEDVDSGYESDLSSGRMWDSDSNPWNEYERQDRFIVEREDGLEDFDICDDFNGL